jgi:hypothetical protein
MTRHHWGMAWRRLAPLAAYIALLIAVRGTGFAAVALVVGLAMALVIGVWHRRSPQSLSRFTESLTRLLGGTHENPRPWRQKTRGLVLVVIGSLGLVASVAVMNDPRDFAGGPGGGAVLGAMALGALVVGVSLVAGPRE